MFPIPAGWHAMHVKDRRAEKKAATKGKNPTRREGTESRVNRREKESLGQGEGKKKGGLSVTPRRGKGRSKTVGLPEKLAVYSSVNSL